MGKPPSSQKLQQFANKFISANKPLLPTQTNPPPIKSKKLNNTQKQMETSAESSAARRHPLSAVVADCVKRWFQETLKEAKAGDVSMQVLVGQMYFSGYGVVTDPHKGRAWISRASRIRSSALKVGDKRPGYNASDSDSDEVAEDVK